MVTLVQQQQQTVDDNHQHQKEQDCSNGAASVERVHAVDKFHGEVAKPAKETAVVVPGNGSVGDSSTQCSDIDDADEEEEEETDVEQDGGWITNLPVSSTLVRQHQATTNGDVVLPSADPSNFGDVCVKNSTNVHLGNKTFYKGPVTIKQFVYTNPIPIQEANKFEGNVSINISDLSTNKDDEVANESIFPQNTELNKVVQLLWTWRCAVLSCVIALIFLTATVLAIVHLSRPTVASPISPEIPNSSLKDIIITSVRFVERNEWLAQPPAGPLIKLKLPVPYVIISHTATESCEMQSECTLRVRLAQTFHIESKGWSDIAYNFLVGGDGLAYVGRSWDYVGAHSFNFNIKSIGISFIGTFNTVEPPKAQIYAAQKIIELGVKAGKIAPNYILLGHRQVSQTLSPGNVLYNEIQTWPHWSHISLNTTANLS